MMGTVIAAAAGGALLFVSQATADRIDLSAMTCSDFLRSDQATMTVILSWLDGFHQNPEEKAVIDLDRFADNAKRLAGFCMAHPDVDVGTAAEGLFGD